MIGFAQIAGGMPSSVKALTNHLMNKTLTQERGVLAQYYRKGTVSDPLVDLARQVAGQEILFSEALDTAISDYIQKGGNIDQLGAVEERLGKRLSAMALRIEQGLEDAPLAVIRPDINPIVLSKLGIDPDEILTTDQINALLAGRRADGERIEGKKYSITREIPPNPKTGERKWATPIGSYDFCPSPDKSISVAWAFASDVERAQIYGAHIEAAREAVAYIADEIGQARLGNGGRDGWEPGHVGWLEFTHHTARRTMISVENGDLKVEEGRGAAGDPDLHTHFLIPNAVFCDSGRIGSLDTMAIKGFIFEADGYYQARLGTKLREAGFEAHMDERTGAAKMAAVPQFACDTFSKRTRAGEIMARKYTESIDENWDDLTAEQRTARMQTAADSFGQRRRGEKDDVADFDNWKQQASAAGWDVPRSFQFIGPHLPELTDEKRHQKAYEIGLPWLADKLEHRSVVPHWDLRLAALRGLVETGCDGLPDIKKITTLMRREGVTQYGEQTAIVWGQESEKRYTSVTTALHERDELEFVRLARGAARDKSGSIPPGLLRQKMAESGLDFSDAHGQRQRHVIELMGSAGRLGVAVGTAGSGKTEMLKPLVASWQEMGRDVYGASLAWRQADDLVKSGIDKRNLFAFSVLIDRIGDDLGGEGPPPIKLTENSVVCVDELGLLGTRQGLQLLRAREKYGFTVVALGDDKQCGSIEAGAIIDLARRALGPEQVPEILTTKRQQTEREQEIVKLLRDGEAAKALDMKRADGTAELAYGGREGVIKRVAALYAERVQATGKAPTISAPTNSDAHQIGEQVRSERRKLGEIGPDIHLQKATDGERDYTLRLAAGDRVKLFESTKAYLGQGTRRDGRKYAIERSIGRNGSVVEVVKADTAGVTLKAADGRVGTVKWANMPSKNGRTKLAYGYATTIHTSQGSTADEHIFALPSGSASVTGAAGYTASTRHRHTAYLISSEAAERIAVKESRPINDAHDITLDDKWANVAKNFVNQRKIDSALAMLEKVGQVHRGAVKAFHNAVRPDDPRLPDGPSHVGDLVQRLKLDRLMERVSQTVTRVQQAFQREHGPGRSR